MLSPSFIMLLLALAKKSDSQSGGGFPSGPSGGGSGPGPTGGGDPGAGGGDYFNSYNPLYNTISYSSRNPGSQDPYFGNQLGSRPGLGYYNRGGYYDQDYNGYHDGYFGGGGHARYPVAIPQPTPAPPLALPRPRETLFLEKLIPFKIGIFALAKILLKILFFKKIIKFIAILVLLLFIPVISSNLSMGFNRIPQYPGNAFDQGYFRSLQNSKSDKERLDDVKAFVKTAIEAFKDKKKCVKDAKEFSCHMENVLNAIDKKYTFNKITKLLTGNKEAQKTDKEDATKKET